MLEEMPRPELGTGRRMQNEQVLHDVANGEACVAGACLQVRDHVDVIAVLERAGEQLVIAARAARSREAVREAASGCRAVPRRRTGEA